jgi:type IV pilus biogenesis protein CpaD/CtpE
MCKNVWIYACLMILLTGCASNDVVRYIDRPIPDLYLTPCLRDFNDNTIREIILGMDNTIRCYESKQQALRIFLQDNKEE